MRFAIPTSATAEQAFAAVADFGLLDEWEPTIGRSEWTEGHWPRIGSKVCLSTRPWLGWFELNYTLEALGPGRMVRYSGGTDRIRSVDTISCIERPRGSVLVIESTIAARGRLSLLGPVIRAGIGALGSTLIAPALRHRLENDA